jgi:hypothetical protein
LCNGFGGSLERGPGAFARRRTDALGRGRRPARRALPGNLGAADEQIALSLRLEVVFVVGIMGESLHAAVSDQHRLFAHPGIADVDALAAGLGDLLDVIERLAQDRRRDFLQVGAIGPEPGLGRDPRLGSHALEIRARPDSQPTLSDLDRDGAQIAGMDADLA